MSLRRKSLEKPSILGGPCSEPTVASCVHFVLQSPEVLDGFPRTKVQAQSLAAASKAPFRQQVGMCSVQPRSPGARSWEPAWTACCCSTAARTPPLVSGDVDHRVRYRKIHNESVNCRTWLVTTSQPRSSKPAACSAKSARSSRSQESWHACCEQCRWMLLTRQ